MPSPFPGMDPYLEDSAIWLDFHGSFLMAVRAFLNRNLPAPYIARWDRYVWIDEPDSEKPGLVGRPDVFVADRLGKNRDTESVSVLDAPATATLPAIDPAGRPFVKIIDARGKRVVTVIEMLSMANKAAGPDRDAYITKRQEYFRSGTNVVELDFLRNGLRPPTEKPLPPADYYVLVSVATDYPSVGVWPLRVCDPLPAIPVPLDPDVAPILLPLRECMDRAFDEGRFVDDINYELPSPVPLSESDARWAQELLSANLLRKKEFHP